MTKPVATPFDVPVDGYASTSLLERVLLAIGTAEGFHSAIGATLSAVCDATGWCAGQAWVAHESGGFLQAVPVFHCSSDLFHAFRASNSAVMSAPDGCLPGRACKAGRPIGSCDLSDLTPARRDAAYACGLTSAFAFPLRRDAAAGMPLVVLEFFNDGIRPPDDDLARVVGDLAGRIGPVLQRKRAEQTLREVAGRYRSVIEGAPFGFMRTTIAGRIVDANARLASMLGYDGVDDLRRLDLGCDVYVDPEDRTRDLEVSAVSPLAAGIERRWKKRDGALMTVRLKGRAVLDSASASVEFESLVEDVTEKVELEQQLRLAQKMEAVGRLAGGIAHDFNNMLMAISGYAEMLLVDLDRNDRRCDDLREICKAADRAAGLTRQLLAFSRRQPIAPTRLDVCALIGNMEGMLRPLIGEDVELITVTPDQPLWIMGDEGQMEQVVMNLVVNARDAMPGNGRVTIEASTSEISAAFARRLPHLASGRYVTVSVSDTGSGMSSAVKARIFEPFFTTKAAGKGTGLGLSTVYGIVQQTRGHIGVESEAGRGSTFTIYLPESTSAEPPLEPARRTSTVARGTETVLLVEDEPAVRALVRTVLVRGGYQVLEAADGEIALSLVNEHQGVIDLLLTDVVMPKMNGRDLAAAMGRARPGTRVLFMSGYTEGVHPEESNGVTAAFLQKPFVAEALSRKIREVLDAAG